jgi:hypothetical protein
MQFILAGYDIYAAWRCRLCWLAMPVTLGDYASHAVLMLSMQPIISVYAGYFVWLCWMCWLAVFTSYANMLAGWLCLKFLIAMMCTS